MADPHVFGLAVTNSAFLQLLAQAAPRGSTLWTAVFVGNPDLAGGNWAGQPYNVAMHSAMADAWGSQNAYFSVAALVPDATGELARRKANFARLLVLVADDADREQLHGRPSYILATSPGKCQVGVLLARDDPACADIDLVSRVLQAMAKAGLLNADKAGNNAVRYVRLPVGQNQKPRESGPFTCELQHFDAQARYSLADAAAIFGINIDALSAGDAPADAPARLGGPQDELVRSLTGNILTGKNLHDSINMLAASLVASGTAGGAAVNMLRGLMDASAAPRDDRFAARYADIPRAVGTAQKKYTPVVTLSLLQRSVAEQGPGQETEDAEPAPPVALPVPAHLLTIPGMLGRAVSYINATARKPQPLFSVQAALGLASAIMGRKYCTDNNNWPALYLLNIGMSGSGKEHAKFAVERLLEAAGMGKLIGVGRFASESGVVSALIDKPAQFSVLDEFGKMLQSASIAQNFADRNTLKALMEVWGRADGVLRPVAYSTAGLSSRQAEDLGKRLVRKPSLALLAMSTPETLFGGLTTSAINDGFLNRFLMVHSDAARQLARTVEDIAPPTDVIEWMQLVHSACVEGGNMASLAVPHDMEPTPIVLVFDAGALRVFSEMERAVHQRMNELDAEGTSEMLTRVTEMAMRIALIVAVSCGHAAVLRQDAQWACDYVLCHAERNLTHLRDKLADGPFDQLCKDVLRLIRASGERGMTERDLNKASRPWRSAAQRIREDAFRSLERRADVVLVALTGSTGRGRTRTAWVTTLVAQTMANNADNADKTPTDVSPQ